MSSLAVTQDPYERLAALPDNLVGEIIGGQLYTQPRPAGPHALAQEVVSAAPFTDLHLELTALWLDATE